MIAASIATGGQALLLRDLSRGRASDHFHHVRHPNKRSSNVRGCSRIHCPCECHSHRIAQSLVNAATEAKKLLTACLLTGILSINPVLADPANSDTIQSSNYVVRILADCCLS